MHDTSCLLEENGALVFKSKNEFGQILNLKFSPDEYTSCIFWDVCFWIGKRKRGYEYMNQTGRDGLKSLLWAKNCITEFIEKYRQENRSKKCHICIYWDDNRRRDVYFRGLKDIGFEYKRVVTKILLEKTI